MIRLNTEQLRVLEAIGKAPGNVQFRQILDAVIADANANLRKLTGEALLREQGKALFLDELAGKLWPPTIRATLVTESRPAVRNWTEATGLTNGSP